MPVMNANGDIFDERRKSDRRKQDEDVSNDKRVSERRVNDLNSSSRPDIYKKNSTENVQDVNVEPTVEPTVEPEQTDEGHQTDINSDSSNN